MTAKEYLGQIHRLEDEVEHAWIQLQRLQREVSFLTGVRYDGDRVQSSNNTTGFPTVEKLADKELELERMINNLADKRWIIIEQIEGLPNQVHSRLLFERYVNYRNFETIGELMNYSYPHTIRLHGEALMAFTKKYDIK